MIDYRNNVSHVFSYGIFQLNDKYILFFPDLGLKFTVVGVFDCFFLQINA